MRTIVNQNIESYLSNRYHYNQPVRVAVIPFDVPETFARPGEDMHHFGRRLAKNFQEELLQRGTFSIVELFDRESWPGKRDDFFSGNYQSIDYARNAGYDFVLIGHMQDIRNDEQLVVYSKLIDVSNSVTVWSAKATVTSSQREINKGVDSVFKGTGRPELFYFSDQAEEVARCTVEEMIMADTVPEP
ncbi:MAG: hypothetical protein KDD66_17405 [Bdellovibrionales bacterium]|nr:hypothetical protein [Bdellovibrionales bacterium]